MSRTKDFILPEIEFANDPMMCALHKIRLKMYQETKNMSNEEWVKYIQEKVRKLHEAHKNKVLIK